MSDMKMDYEEIAQRLQAAFPEGTLQTGKSVHIPVQAYLRRLEEAARDMWSWRLVEMPVVQEMDQAIVVRGELTIGESTRSGIGFSHYVREHTSKSVSTYKNSVSAAESDAIRNACDKFLMGWIDLAPHRDWGKNPGVGLSLPEQENSTKLVCKKCNKLLKAEDVLFMELHDIRLPFCSEHVPPHLHKK